VPSIQTVLAQGRMPVFANFLILLAFLSTHSPILAQATLRYEHGDPTDLDQFSLEKVNRARTDPAAEGIRLDEETAGYALEMRTYKPNFFTDIRKEFASYPKAPPLAFNPYLLKSAQAYSQEMTLKNFFSHYGDSKHHSTPTTRAIAQGYSGGVGENISGAGAVTVKDIGENHFGFMVDANNVSDATMHLGHRLNALDPKWNEVGIGVFGSREKGRVTQDFGISKTNYYLGVVYEDKNGNRFYDPGEGIEGVEIRPSVGKYYAVTSSSGGYAIPMDFSWNINKGIRVILTASGGGLEGTLKEEVTLEHQNLKIDFIVEPEISDNKTSALTETTTPEQPNVNEEEIPAASSDWNDAQSHEGGWRSMEWFGNYYEASSGWIYHENLEWLYRSESGFSSVWLWHPELGWLWTSENVFPFLYLNNWNSWLWMKKETDKSIYLFDKLKGEWFPLDSNY
jgi:hypothetical protein